jgi:hypothetical protein
VAAYPNLDELVSPTQWPETSEWLADAVLANVAALENSVQRYRAHLLARGQRLTPTGF